MWVLSRVENAEYSDVSVFYLKHNLKRPFDCKPNTVPIDKRVYSVFCGEKAVSPAFSRMAVMTYKARCRLSAREIYSKIDFKSLFAWGVQYTE